MENIDLKINNPTSKEGPSSGVIEHFIRLQFEKIKTGSIISTVDKKLL